MKTTRNVRIGKQCKKHPEIKGLRYAGNSTCVECAKEQSRKHYASLEMTPAQKITTLLGEIAQLKADNQSLRKDAERYRFIVDGQGYFLEEQGICGHSNEKAAADAAIDFYIENGCPP